MKKKTKEKPKYLTKRDAWLKIADAFDRRRLFDRLYTGSLFWLTSSGLCHAIYILEQNKKINETTVGLMQRDIDKCRKTIHTSKVDYFWPNTPSYREFRGRTARMLARKFSKKTLLAINKDAKQ